MNTINPKTLAKLTQAFDWVIEKAGGEKRNFSHQPKNPKHNKLYWVHLQDVYELLIQMGVSDEDTLIAGVLHDIVEDSDVTLDEVEIEFGKRVRNIVDLCTKPDDFDKNDPNSNKKFFARFYDYKDKEISNAAMHVKVADRLTNMIGILFIDGEERKMKYLKETIEYYIPMAEQIGQKGKMQNVVDYALKILAET